MRGTWPRPRSLAEQDGTGGDENDLIPLGRGIDPDAALLSPRGKSAKNMAEDKDGFERPASQPNSSEISEDEIDRNLIGTFPASDSPSWTLGIERNQKLANESPME